MTLIGATTENPYYEVNSALLSRSPGLRAGAAVAGGRRGRSCGAARRRSAPSSPDELVELVARRSGGDARSALNIVELAAETARAEGAPVERGARRGRSPEAAGRLRQGLRRALRLHVGVHQVDAGERPGRGRLLPGGDARGRRGRALHRAPDDRARLRGRRQRRPARTARRGRRRAGGRARRPARGAAQPRAGGDLPRPGAEVERELRRAEPRRRGRAGARERRAAEGAAGCQLVRPAARPRRGLRLPARRPARLRGRATCRRSFAGAATSRRRATARSGRKRDSARRSFPDQDARASSRSGGVRPHAAQKE